MEDRRTPLLTRLETPAHLQRPRFRNADGRDLAAPPCALNRRRLPRYAQSAQYRQTPRPSRRTTHLPHRTHATPPHPERPRRSTTHPALVPNLRPRRLKTPCTRRSEPSHRFCRSPSTPMRLSKSSTLRVPSTKKH